MTLHEAIEQVLQDFPKGLSATMICKQINSKQLYVRKDGANVPSSQVLARVKNHKDLFQKKGDKIVLVENDRELLASKRALLSFWSLNTKYRNLFRANSDNAFIYLVFNIYNLSLQLKPENLEQVLGLISIEFFPKTESENSIITVEAWENIKEEVTELILNFELSDNKEVILYKILSDYLKKQSSNRSGIVMPDLDLLLSHLPDFEHDFQLLTLSNKLPLTEILIKSKWRNNIRGHRSLKEWYIEFPFLCKRLLFAEQENKDITIDSVQPNQTSSIALAFPPIGMRGLQYTWGPELEIVANSFTESNNVADKIILILPDNILFSGKHQTHRESLLVSELIEKVIRFPIDNSSGIALRSLNIVYFNFKQRHNEVFFADFTKVEDFKLKRDFEQIIDLIRNPKELADLSGFKRNYDLIKNGSNLLPSQVIDLGKSIDLNEGWKEYSLDEVLASKSTGVGINRSSLYKEGEFKIIRVTNLNKDGIFPNEEVDILGADPDTFKGRWKSERECVLIARIGTELKPTVFKGFDFVPDQSVLVLNPKKEILSLEFLASELRQEYIDKQFKLYDKGTAMVSRTLTTLKNIRIQVPPIYLQQETLLKRKAHGIGLSEDDNDTKLELLKLRNEFVHQKQSIDIETQKLLNERRRLRDFIGVLKHTLKQPLGTLTNDFGSIRNYLTKLDKQNVISLKDLTIEPEEWEDPNDLSFASIENVINRSENALSTAHSRLSKSQDLMKVETVKMTLEGVSIKSFLLNCSERYPDIKFQIVGDDVEWMIDKSLWNILLDNLVENATKFGILKNETPLLRFEVKIAAGKSGNMVLKIIYYNNGEPVPSDFTIEQFIKKGETLNSNIGDGFGGYLIGSIMNKHSGECSLIPLNEIVPKGYFFALEFTLNEL
jgi:signal transduction histidine kinase